MTENDTDTRTESGSILIGFGCSCFLAVSFGVLGGAFEALILWPVFGFVTVTLGPDLVFVFANTVLLEREKKPRTIIGIVWGYFAVVVTAVVSFAVFMEMAPNFVL